MEKYKSCLQTVGNERKNKATFDGARCPYLAYNIPRIRVADEDYAMEEDGHKIRERKKSFRIV